jgi:hypothetical protein
MVLGRPAFAFLLVSISLLPTYRAVAEGDVEGVGRWFDLRTSPFIPLPEVGTDPNAGTTFGILPIFLVRDEDGRIRQIIAPDIVGNEALGLGAHFRFLSYPSPDTEWHVVGGAMQVIERNFDALYSTGIERQGPWSIDTRLNYERSATERFYGVGNNSSLANRTNYTAETGYLQGRIGWNMTHDLQIAFEMRPRFVQIEPGTLEQSIPPQFLGGENDFLNRLSVTYDTRDSPTIPTRGSTFTGYAGFSDRHLLSSISYQMVGVDLRHFEQIGEKFTVAGHAALRYMPDASGAPFWALSSLGGDRSEIGERQPLRGYGAGRFIDNNLFSSSLELRTHIFEVDLFTQHVGFEAAPFIETGRVFHSVDKSPFNHLHIAGGVGFRAVAQPFIVGYVDIGYGSEGAAIFTGINYPF